MAYDHRKYQPFTQIDRPHRQWPSKRISTAPAWCAVDLRDGNQALVRPMTVAQKKTLFALLVEIGVKEIEVGFPAASQLDFDFVRALIEDDRIPDDVTIQVLTQAREDLIARTFESLDGAKRAIVHLYNSTSTLQRERVFNLDRDGVRTIAEQGARWVVEQARLRPETRWAFEYSPESFTGTEIDFAADVVNSVVEIWRDETDEKVIINLPATVEMSTPNIYADMVEWMDELIVHRDRVRLSLHTHNDRGCAVAAAELGLLAGADRLEGTLLGNGERTGNMDLVTAAMNLYSQGIDPKLDLSDMRRIMHVVESCTEISSHPRHPYAGELVYTAFSGSHQDAIRKCLGQQRPDEPWQVAYLPIDPRDLGRRYDEVVRINSQSGKGGVLHVLERDHRITLPRWLQIAYSKVVQQFAECNGGELAGGIVYDLFRRTYLPQSNPRVWTESAGDCETHVRADVGSWHIDGRGVRIVDAFIAGAEASLGMPIVLEAFDEVRLDGDAPASFLACVRWVSGEHSVEGVGLADDVTEATLLACVAAFERLPVLTDGQTDSPRQADAAPLR